MAKTNLTDYASINCSESTHTRHGTAYVCRDVALCFSHLFTAIRSKRTSDEFLAKFSIID
jgi:hypothetical protein